MSYKSEGVQTEISDVLNIIKSSSWILNLNSGSIKIGLMVSRKGNFKLALVSS
jgi:hypothetical protein